MSRFLVFAPVILCSLFVFFLSACVNPWMESVFNLNTITFNTNGGNDIAQQKLLRGEHISKPNNPYRINYIFTGWFSDYELTSEWNFSDIPQQSMTLFASWIPGEGTAILTGIEIINQPKLVYMHGDSLDLTDLVLRLNYDDDSFVNVPFANFSARGITTAPAHGTILTRSLNGDFVHNGMPVSVLFSDILAQTQNLVVEKAVIQSITFPQASPLEYLQDLFYSQLTGGTTSSGNSLGTFAWADSSIVPVIVNSGFEVIFTPNDTDNYDWSAVSLTSIVQITVLPSLITSVNISITSPAKDAAPSLTAVNNAVIAGQFTMGSVTWTTTNSSWTQGSNFLGDTVYTAQVVLTAGDNFEFAGNPSITIGGQPGTVTAQSASSITISRTFNATLSNVVIDLSVQNAASIQLNYVHGQQLALSSISVMLIFIDGNNSVIPYSDFDDWNIGVNYPHNTALRRHLHNGHEIEITYSDITRAVGTLIVNPKPLTIESVTHTMQYTGSTAAEIDPHLVVLGGFVDNEGSLVHVGSMTANYTSANAGTTSMNITDVQLTGERNGNYTIITPVSINAIGGITKAAGSAAASIITEIIPAARTVNVSVTFNNNEQTAEFIILEGIQPPDVNAVWINEGSLSHSFIDLEPGKLFTIFTRSRENNNYETGAFAEVTDITFYSVIFHVNGGSAVAPQTLYAAHHLNEINNIVEKPVPDPQRTGFEFVSWYRDASFEHEWDFDTAVTGNLTLYARWQALHSIDIGVGFMPDGGFTISPAVPPVIYRYASPTEFNVTLINLPEGFTSIEWRVNGILLNEGNPMQTSFVISALDARVNQIGKKLLNIIVIRNGIPQSVSVEFEVRLEM